MPVAFEDYAKHFEEAKNAWTRLYMALDQLSAAVGMARQSPSVLAGPSNQPWPTQDHLREMFKDAQAKTGPLMAEYSQLAQDVKSYAPDPNSASQRPSGTKAQPSALDCF